MKGLYLIISVFVMASVLMLGCSKDQSTIPTSTELEYNGTITPNPEPPPPPPPPPPPGDEGCTPGYWKNHIEMWPVDPDLDFDSSFGVDYFDPDITLRDAINAKGGGVNYIARHGTAAGLSAVHPGVAYPLDVFQVIHLVQIQSVDILVAYNELGCPLDN